MTELTDAIVAGVDGSESALRAVRWAAAEAAARKLALYLVTGFDPMLTCYGGGLPAPQSVYDSLARVAQDHLAEAAEAAHAVAGELAVTTQRPDLSPVPLLIELSRTARMIVLGSSGHGGFTGMLTGSTAVAVTAHAECPVVVVRPREGPMPAEGPVVVGVDGSPTSERALAMAFDEASRREVELIAVHAWSDADYIDVVPAQFVLLETEPTRDEQARVLAESLAGWQDKYPDVVVRRVVVKDRPRHLLLEWTEQAQLVVVGSRGRGGFRGLLLGSTSQALIHHARCPVMIVRPERSP
jgi:nucleotide-binding universal stress UspA family protein